MTPDFPPLVDAFLTDEEKEFLPNHEQLISVLERILTRLEALER